MAYDVTIVGQLFYKDKESDSLQESCTCVYPFV